MSGKTTTARLGLTGLLAVVAMVVMAVGASAAFGYSEFKATEYPDNFTGTGGLATFESEKGNTVMCEKSESSGKVENNTMGKVTVTYSGKCELKGTVNEECPTIKTKELLIQPGDLAGGKLGILLSPAEERSETMAEFTCNGGTKILVTGAVVCETEATEGKPVLKGNVVCAESSAGAQTYTSIEVGGKTLTGQELKAEATVAGFLKITEKDAQISTETLTFSQMTEQTM